MLGYDATFGTVLGEIVRLDTLTDEIHDFSVHADHDGLFDFLDSYRDSTVLVNHGDRCSAFAGELREDGYDARAPELGDSVTV